MFYELLKRSSGIDFNTIKTTYMALSLKTVNKNGVLSRASSFEVIDTAEALNKYSVFDFKLENIIALGSFDILKPQVMSDTNPLSVVNSFSAAVEQQLKPKQNENV